MGVKLEVFRMMLYLSFPVAMFWISNQAEYFEEYVIKRKVSFLIKMLQHIFSPKRRLPVQGSSQPFPPRRAFHFSPLPF
uniref:Protein PET100 homolog, mitochondrial n=1 Tax=Podarcis muralis TaxID=64176 RepID=A0A670KCF8_PODMU